MELEYTMPFLLGTDALYDIQIERFNTLKAQQNSNWAPIEDKYSIPVSVRADPLWAILLPRSDYLSGSDCAGGCKWNKICDHKARYVLIRSQFSQYIEIISGNGAETCRIKFEKYGMGTIWKILDDVSLNDAERVEKIKGVYAFVEANKDMKPFI